MSATYVPIIIPYEKDNRTAEQKYCEPIRECDANHICVVTNKYDCSKEQHSKNMELAAYGVIFLLFAAIIAFFVIDHLRYS